MERKETLKVEEDLIHYSSTFSTDPNPLTDMLDFVDQKSSLGFMELLGIQDFSTSIFDSKLFQVPYSTEEPLAPTQASPVPESSEVLNTPATPKSSSISSASSGAEQTKVGVDAEEEEQQQHQKTKQQLKPKKTSSSQKKQQKEQRFAFMTKSELDHLEDGYRWRKYGQKAVKNSPFPRSYYRCTSSSCNVKKRVERSFTDPTIVVTTYEGQHTHHSPVMMHRAAGGNRQGSAFALPLQMTALTHQPQSFNNLAVPLNCGYNMMMNSTNPAAAAAAVHERRPFCSSTPAAYAFLRDNGLLQDIVPSIMRKEE